MVWGRDEDGLSMDRKIGVLMMEGDGFVLGHSFSVDVSCKDTWIDARLESADSIGISSTVGISEEDVGRICEEETSL
jgi:hypothetical protein